MTFNFRYNRIRCISAIILTLAVVLFCGSCKKIDETQSTRLQKETDSWKTIDDAKANLIGMYALMRNALAADNGHWLMGDLRNGDFLSTNRADLQAIIEGRLNASYPVINSITNWRRFYAVVNATTIFIERSPQIVKSDNRYTQANNNVDIAQARALRAFAYFYMVRIWGDVPLLTTTHDGDFIKAPRTSKERVLSFCKTELLAAAQVLPFRYGGTDVILPGAYYGLTTGTDPNWYGTLMTRISVYSLLAHVTAWQQNYLETDIYTKFVLDNYTQLVEPGVTDYNCRYLTINELTLNVRTNETQQVNPFAYKRATQLLGFAFEYGYGYSSANGHIEQLTLASPFVPKVLPEIFVPKDSIRKIFTNPADLRFSIDPQTGLYRENYFTQYGTQRPMFSKIKIIEAVANTSDYAVFSSAVLFTRLEEITLLRAEALAVMGQKEGAVLALNKAAALRGYVPYPDGSTKDLINEIFAERRRELMGEGWRWYDLIRYNRIKRTSGTFITKNGQPLTFAQAESAGAIYWPVSQDVINANPAITQNNFWK